MLFRRIAARAPALCTLAREVLSHEGAGEGASRENRWHPRAVTRRIPGYLPAGTSALAKSSTMARLKAGMSSGLRLVTRPLSITTS